MSIHADRDGSERPAYSHPSRQILVEALATRPDEEAGGLGQQPTDLTADGSDAP